MALSAPSRIVLDTSAYAWMRRGHTGVLDVLSADGTSAVLVPTVVLGELDAGFRLGRREIENRTMLGEFLDEPFTAVLPVTADVARVYGRLFAGLRRSGTPAPVNDIWIAACTIDAGAHLLTFDADFERIPGLDLTRLAA